MVMCMIAVAASSHLVLLCMSRCLSSPIIAFLPTHSSHSRWQSFSISIFNSLYELHCYPLRWIVLCHPISDRIVSFNSSLHFRLPKGPRAILFREFLPIMKPLLDTLRDIARQRKKTVGQVCDLDAPGQRLLVAQH